MIPTREQYESMVIAHGTPGIRDEQRLRLWTALMLTYDNMAAQIAEWAKLKDDIGADLSRALDRAEQAETKASVLDAELQRYGEVKDELQRLRAEVERLKAEYEPPVEEISDGRDFTPPYEP